MAPHEWHGRTRVLFYEDQCSRLDAMKALLQATPRAPWWRRLWQWVTR